MTEFEQKAKRYKVWIYDKDSGCEQPITCTVKSVREARAAGNRYIRVWSLRGACITKVEKAEMETVNID